MRTTSVAYADSASSSAAPVTGPSDLYVMKADGTGLNKLSEEMSYAQSPLWSPLWSPDGKQIAFSGTGEMKYVVNADGTEPRELLPNARRHLFVLLVTRWRDNSLCSSAFSRGARYLCDRCRRHWPDQPHQYQDDHRRCAPWSPDGKQIAFTRGDVGDVYVDQGIYVMNANGTGRTRLANNPNSPSFTPRERE